MSIDQHPLATEIGTRGEQLRGHEHMFLDAIYRPVDILLSRSPENLDSLPFHMQFSESRGNQPVISREPIDVENTSIAVIANAGALDYNSPAFVDPTLDPKAAGIMAEFPGGYSHRILAYTKPGDKFVFETPDVEKSLYVLSMIADFYESIGLEVTRDFVPVESTCDWVEAQRGNTPLLFGSALDPLALVSFGRSSGEEDAIMRRMQSNVAAYTKFGAERLWAARGVPVPEPTHYVLGGEGNKEIVAQALADGLHAYEHIVVTERSGSAGDGIHFATHEEALRLLMQEYSQDHLLQLQGRLDLAGSPCTIVNIAPDGSYEILMTSEQVFAKPGAHGGNMWIRKGAVFPKDFDPAIHMAITAMAEAGVVGQVNIDTLLTRPRQRRLTGGRSTLLREINVRPAGSSPILKMRKGNIEGQRIDRINTVGTIACPFEKLPALQQALSVIEANALGLKAGVYHYDVVHDKVGIAFIGAEGVAEDAFNTFKEEVSAAIASLAA